MPGAGGGASRRLSRHRRLAAGALAGVSVAAGLGVLAPGSSGTAVLTAARDLQAGTSLRAGDVAARTLPADAVPAGALLPDDPALGRPLASPVRAGEPLTDVRLVGPALLDALGDDTTGLVAAPVRVADPGVVPLLQVGDRVDVLAARASPDGSATRPAERAAAAVRVVALPPTPDDPLASGVDGALVVLAVDAPTAARLATAAVDARLSLVLRGSVA